MRGGKRNSQKTESFPLCSARSISRLMARRKRKRLALKELKLSLYETHRFNKSYFNF